ncbi:MAG: PD-(D/E)XK nuclease domain-containing protein [Paraprevotella sp.]|nr:PD-(D/E)XK nuclease domain-containing protein [Paraprevotella sp.]
MLIITNRIDKSAQEALDQIEEKGYADTFAGDNRKIFKIGINFSPNAKRIEGWEIR